MPCLRISRQIKAILTTRQGEDEADYRENVLHAWLG